MGLCSSSVTKKKYSAFDERITTALQKYKKLTNSTDDSAVPKSERVNSFNQVLTRSNRIRKSLQHIRSVFARFDVDQSNSIDRQELTAALQILGNGVAISAEDIEKVFNEADIEQNQKLSLKEFIVCLLLGYLLGQIKLNVAVEESKESVAAAASTGSEDVFEGHAKEIQFAFNNIIGCYLLFDVDASGDLSRDEVMKQLHDKSGAFKDRGAQKMMSEERWKELDWDGDGHITFREFAWAMQNWISQDDE